MKPSPKTLSNPYFTIKIKRFSDYFLVLHAFIFYERRKETERIFYGVGVKSELLSFRGTSLAR